MEGARAADQMSGSSGDSKIVRLMGGLGNQMFQYAFGLRLEADLGKSVKFDVTSGFLEDRYCRKPALQAFNTRIAPARDGEIPLGMDWPSPWHRMARFAWEAMPQPLRKVAYERTPFRFDPGILRAPPGPAYYFGYWQCPDYSSSLRQRLVEDFSLRRPFSPTAAALMQEIQGRRSISVHVRFYRDRGADGKLIPNAPNRHVICPAAFYEEGVRRIGVGDGTTAYIFSDDPGTAKTELRLPAPCRYVAELCSCSDAEELLLMGACQHHVISNSTFGWWGAWLGRNPEKIVVAPGRWLPELPHGEAQICPKEWVRI